MTSHPLNLISAVISSEKSFLPTLDSHLHPSCPVSTPCFLPKSSLRFSHLSIDLHCFFLLQREGSQGLVPYHLHGTLIHHNAWCTVGQLHFWLGGWMQRKKEQITILCENLKPGKEKGAWEKNGHCFKFNCIPPKLYFEVLTLLPVKVTLSESMVSQMESSSHEVIRIGPNPIGSLSSLGEKKKIWMQTERRDCHGMTQEQREDNHVKRRAEAGVRLPQTSPWAFWRSVILLITLILNSRPPLLWENTLLLFKASLSGALCSWSLRKGTEVAKML